ncbi:MAG: hypothetical protein WC523_06015 [Patescibacteria group bacterium]
MELNKPIDKPKSLKDFKNFMSLNGVGWVLINNTESIVSYQKNIQAKKGNCLITLILLLLGIIPGLLYLYFSHQSASTNQLTVLADEDGYLTASGDEDGLELYNQFISGNSIKFGQSPEIMMIKEWIKKNPIIIICVILALFIIIICY